MIALRAWTHRTKSQEERFCELQKRDALWSAPPSTGDPLAKLCSDQAAKITAQRKRIAELADDADRLKALWLYPPADIAFWKVAYPDLEDFRRAIDGYTKKAQDEKWGYPS